MRLDGVEATTKRERSSRSSRWRVALLFTGGLLVSLASGAETYTLLVDADNDPSTGCTVTGTSGSPIPGVERQVLIVGDTAQLVSATGLDCDPGSGVFNPSGSLAGASLPTNIGSGGMHGGRVAEVRLPLGDLGLSPGDSFGVRILAEQADGLQDLLQAAAGAPIVLSAPGAGGGGPAAVPTLSFWFTVAFVLLLATLGLRQVSTSSGLVSLLVAFVGVSLIAAPWSPAGAGPGFSADGDPSDWSVADLQVLDALGDQLAGQVGLTDLVAAFLRVDAAALCLRFDVRLNRIHVDDFSSDLGWFFDTDVVKEDPADSDRAVAEVSAGRLLVESSQDCGRAEASARFSVSSLSALASRPYRVEIDVLDQDRTVHARSLLRVSLDGLSIEVPDIRAFFPSPAGTLAISVDASGNVTATHDNVVVPAGFLSVSATSFGGVSLFLDTSANGADCFHDGRLEIDEVRIY